MANPREVIEDNPSLKRQQAMERGRKGGIATARNHSREWLKERATRGGQVVLEMYSADYFRHINSQRRIRRGWPQGKLRKSVSTVEQNLEQQVSNGELSSTAGEALQEMLHSVERELR